MSNPTTVKTTGDGRQIAISPAYWISRYSDRFVPEQILAGLPEATDMGFKTFQPEIFHRDVLYDWRDGGAASISSRAFGCGIFGGFRPGDHLPPVQCREQCSCARGFIESLLTEGSAGP